MKPENTKVQRYLTDQDRDAVLKLIGCGLSFCEIATLTNFSKSTISYIGQAHKACLEQDWSTLQRLSTCVRPTVDWAMKVTGTDKVFLETFQKEEEPEKDEAGPNISGSITREDFIAMYVTAQDIRNLLVEIRNVLNEIK